MKQLRGTSLASGLAGFPYRFLFQQKASSLYKIRNKNILNEAAYLFRLRFLFQQKASSLYKIRNKNILNEAAYLFRLIRK